MRGSEDKRARVRRRRAAERGAAATARPKSEGSAGSPLRTEGGDFDWRRYAQSRLHDHAHR